MRFQRRKMFETFAVIGKIASEVAETLGVAVTCQEMHTAQRGDMRTQGLDPQLVIEFTHRDGRRFTLLAVAYDCGCGMSLVADGDLQIGDDDGFAPHPWRAAVLEELMVKLAPLFPREVERLRKVAQDVHSPPPAALEWISRPTRATLH